jgi:Flp pilus assembly protein TadG
MSRNGKQRGSAMIEFTLVGIPLVFILISTFEVARGMWIYHTLAYAVKEGTRYASVHGATCALAPNTCTVTVAQVVQRVLNQSTGLLPGELNLTLTTPGSVQTCNPVSSCQGNNTNWPPAPDNAQGTNITITGTYPFPSAISMFWPGAGPSTQASFVTFGASSTETMQN